MMNKEMSIKVVNFLLGMAILELRRKIYKNKNCLLYTEWTLMNIL